MPMTRQRNSSRRCTVAEVCSALEGVAPLGLAQEWDNVGLIAGDVSEPVERVLLCIDLTPEVTHEAIKRGFQFVMAYHPPIFRPITRLCAAGSGMESTIFRCIREGVAVYSMHTALDAAEGGTNDVLAGICGLTETEPLEYVDEPGSSEVKLVAFIPPDALDRVAEAVFGAGAGRIGDYTRCSYRLRGEGTFFGGESTSPTVGKRGRLETVDEVRFEAIAPASRVPEVVSALRAAHPYEEPAFDLYPLRGKPVRGIGRTGKLPKAVPLRLLARRLKRGAGIKHVQVVGDPDSMIDGVSVIAGSAGSLAFRSNPGAGDAIVSGEMRHHDMLTVLRRGASAILLGHSNSERPALGVLAERIRAELPAVKVEISKADREPFGIV